MRDVLQADLFELPISPWGRRICGFLQRQSGLEDCAIGPGGIVSQTAGFKDFVMSWKVLWIYPQPGGDIPPGPVLPAGLLPVTFIIALSRIVSEDPTKLAFRWSSSLAPAGLRTGYSPACSRFQRIPNPF